MMEVEVGSATRMPEPFAFTSKLISLKELSRALVKPKIKDDKLLIPSGPRMFNGLMIVS
jgi:hypothetical protein